jgi:cell division septal protein FtsQ
MSLEDRYIAIRDDPEKRGKAFKWVWMISYGMLLLGAFLTVYFIWVQLYT